ncbi:MAG TPA: hypothetical protein VN207_02700 [Ktedonobacteraceae bacterium]|nr:hypothetical protein [Ktedonobacteraceae bacterium]
MATDPPSSSMNAVEREALGNILFALFLESPKRKTILKEQHSAPTQTRTSSPTRRPQKYHTGGAYNG